MKKFLLPALLGFAFTGFAQKVNNKLSFQKGQKMEVIVETKKTSSFELMGQPMETSVASTVNQTFDVTDVTDTGIILEQKVKRIQLEMNNPMQSGKFDSEIESDRNGQLGKILEQSLKNKYSLTLDATGKITAVKIDEDSSNNKNKEAEDMMDLMSAQMGLPLGVPKAGDPSTFKILPEKEVRQGDSWTDSSSSEGQKIKTTYTVKSITDNEITLDFTEELNINTTQQIMGTEAIIKSNNKSTGTILIDRASGLLKQKTTATEEEGSMEGQGQILPVKGKTNTILTVKNL